MDELNTEDVRQSMRIGTLLALFSIERDYSKKYKGLRETADVLIDGLVHDLERQQMISGAPTPQPRFGGMSAL